MRIEDILKRKKLFLSLLALLILLVGICIFLIITESKKEPLQNEIPKQDTTISPLETKVLPKPQKELANSNRHTTPTVFKSLVDAQEEISKLLQQNPLLFDANSSLLESRESADLIIEILNSLEERQVAIIVHSYYDKSDSRIENRKISQRRADLLVAYIDEYYSAFFINAIGYGSEFSFENNNTKKKTRIEITLQRIIEESTPKN